MGLRAACALVGVAGALAAAAGIPGLASYGARTTGDEPHYLVTALALVEDGSLDTRRVYAEEDYRPFHASGLGPQAKRGLNGELVEPHEPLLPVLLAGPLALGGWAAAKALLSLLAGALAALLLWIAVERLGVPLARAAVVVSAFALSAPFAVYGQHVYPELPAALAVAAAIGALLGPLGAAGIAVVALAAIALPWLTTKLALVSAVLAGIALVRLVRRGDGRQATALAGTLALAGVAFLAAHRALYGGWTPYAAGSHFVGGEFTVVGREPDYGARSTRLLGLLVDRSFGLAAWQPAWLLVVPALAALARARPRGWPELALPLAAGWLIATYLAATMHGWWWPGRHVVAVLPAAVLAIAWWAGRVRAVAWLAAVLGALGIVTYAWLAVETWAEARTWVVDFARTSGWWYVAWREALPDYRDLSAAAWTLHGVWLAAVAVLAYVGWRSVSPPKRPRPEPSAVPGRSRAASGRGA